LDEEPQGYDKPLSRKTYTADEDDSSRGLGGKIVNWVRRRKAWRRQEER
jgi:hypothetical protein